MPRDNDIPDEDRKLFRQHVGKVRRLRHDRIQPHAKAPPPVPVKTREDEAQVLRDMLSDDFDPLEVETGEELLFARPGLQKSVLRKLRRGRYSIGDVLDLHGMRVHEARSALVAFLYDCRVHRVLCVKIIHGKGLGSHQKRPVLKGKVSKWLSQRDEVLAYCSARPNDGGTGAVYVLLRRRAV